MKFRAFLFSTNLIVVLFFNVLECSLNETLSGTIVDKIDERPFYSQASQDKFVYTLLYDILGKKDQGYYLEIGAGEPIYINNSYFFEKNFKWSGVSVDISDDIRQLWYAKRKNALFTIDATKANYNTILQGFPDVIDYLSLDIDESYDTVLMRIPFDKYIFKIITIEHDFYRYGDVFREREREILKSRGYHLLCPNVTLKGFILEDWWIHPSAFPSDVFSTLLSLDLQDKECAQLIENIQKACGCLRF